MRLAPRQGRFLWWTLVFILLGLFLYYFRRPIIEVLTPFILGIALAYLLNPLVVFLESKKVPRVAAISIIYLLIIGGITLAAVLFIPVFIVETNELIKMIPAYKEKADEILLALQQSYQRYGIPESLRQMIVQNLQGWEALALRLLQRVVDGILGLFGQLFNLILAPILAFYFLKDHAFFKKQVEALLPPAYRQRFLGMAKDIDRVLGNFIRGQITISLFVGILTAIVLAFIGMDYSLILGAISAITNIIPYFGPFIGLIPALVIALLRSPATAFWVLVGYTAVQQVESNILAPKVMSESVGLHPVAVILALLVGSAFFGVWGMLLAVPAAAVIKVVAGHLITAFIYAKS